MRAGRLAWFIVTIITFIILSNHAHADLISPAITHVYFEKDGMPYNGSVEYTVNCYGYSYSYPPVTKTPGTYLPELVFHYSAEYKEYGSPIYQPYYLHYRSIDWCDLEGQAEGQGFVIRNFSQYPFTRCDAVQHRVVKIWGVNREYYFETPEYFSCKQFMRKDSGSGAGTIWIDRQSFSDLVPAKRTSIILLPGMRAIYGIPPSSHIVINRTDFAMDPDQYVGYLETCDPVTDPWCSGWILNGKPLKSYPGLRPLTDNATDLEQNPCNRFLIRADPSLIMPFTDRDPWDHPCIDACNDTYEICESRFTIPSGNGILARSVDPTAPVDEMSAAAHYQGETIPVPSQLQTVSAAQSPVESLYCGIVELLGGKCE